MSLFLQDAAQRLPDGLTVGALMAAVGTLFTYLVVELRAGRTRAEAREDRAVTLLEKHTSGYADLTAALNKAGAATVDAVSAAKANGDKLDAIDRRLRDRFYEPKV